MSDANLTQVSESQDKYVLNARDIRKLDRALQGIGKIPYLQTIIKGDNKVRHLNREQKIGRSMLQLAFVVTYENQYVLLKQRNTRNTQLSLDNAKTEEKQKYSILTSALCDTAPRTEIDLLRVFHKKVPATALRNRKPDAINFLGLIRNRVSDKNNPEKYATYYFYVYEIAFPKKPFNSISKLCKKIKEAETKDSSEHFALGCPITEATASLIHSNYHADAVAYQLLLSKQQKEQYSRSVTWIEAGKMSSLHNTSNAYFIIHAYWDYRLLVFPLTEKLKSRGIQYWTEEEHAEPNISWNLCNAKNEQFAKGVICIESKHSCNNDNVIREIKLAMELRRQDSRYELIRLRADDFTQEDEDILRTNLMKAGLSEASIKQYISITTLHYNELLLDSIIEKLKK